MISLEIGTIQLIGGDPDSIRICRVEGESLVASVIPRDKLLETKQLPDIPPRGIYYLLDEDHGNLNRVYAGQTTQGVTLEDDLEFNFPQCRCRIRVGRKPKRLDRRDKQQRQHTSVVYRKEME